MSLLLSNIILTLPGQQDKNGNRSGVTPCNIIFFKRSVNFVFKEKHAVYLLNNLIRFCVLLY